MFGASVCQWSHNCVKGESWQIPDRPHLSGVGFIEWPPSLCLVVVFAFMSLHLAFFSIHGFFKCIFGGKGSQSVIYMTFLQW